MGEVVTSAISRATFSFFIRDMIPNVRENEMFRTPFLAEISICLAQGIVPCGNDSISLFKILNWLDQNRGTPWLDPSYISDQGGCFHHNTGFSTGNSLAPRIRSTRTSPASQSCPEHRLPDSPLGKLQPRSHQREQRMKAQSETKGAKRLSRHSPPL